MHLTIGQKVAYPNQGVCLVEGRRERTVGETSLNGYNLRVLGDNSTIFVPEDNTDSVGLRPLISRSECRKLVDELSMDFEPCADDWKTRSKEFFEKLHSGDVFAAADVLKKLTYLSFDKKLSFREQTMLEKARFLVVSEIRNAGRQKNDTTEAEVVDMVQSACLNHRRIELKVLSASVH